MDRIAAQQIIDNLHRMLPSKFREVATDLAYILADTINRRVSLEEAGKRINSNPEYGAVLRKLAGKSFQVNGRVISFGKESQTGDVSIGQSAGRDATHTVVNIPPNSGLNGLGIFSFSILSFLAVLAVAGLFLVSLGMLSPATQIPSPNPTNANFIPCQ